MNKINILSVQALKEKLYVAFMLFVNRAIGSHTIIEEWFAFYVNKFRTAYERLDEVYLKYDVDACTKAVNEADEVRDKAFRKMRDVIKLSITFPEGEAKTKAAEELLRVIDLYGGIYIPSQGQAAKTATYTNLVDDFETKFSAEVETLGVGALVEALKSAQETFFEAYMTRDECESDFAKGAMADARKKMTEAYRVLVDAINVKVYEDTEGRLTDFINLMNVEIGRNRTHTGQGQVGASGGTGTEESEEGVRFKTATFKFANGDSIKRQVEVGTVLVAPDNTEGYQWKPEVPELMPAKNCTFREVLISEAGGEETDEQVTATFHFADHTEEDIRQAAGTPLTAPANTTGYRWDPEVPATMPAEDTAYYELSVGNSESGGDTGGGSTGGSTGGGNTNPGGGYVPPSNGGGFD